MIKVYSAFGRESRGEDEWRNRLMLAVGKAVDDEAALDFLLTLDARAEDFDRSDVETQIAALEHVEEVTFRASKGLLNAVIRGKDGHDLRPDLFELCRTNNWSLHELKQEASLRWHMSRKEALALSDNLKDVLASSEPKVLEGTFRVESRVGYLTDGNGETICIGPCNGRAWQLYSGTEEQRVVLKGRYKDDGSFYLMDWEAAP
jgi:hypothetical protein